jgi:hypothetical protein
MHFLDLCSYAPFSKYDAVYMLVKASGSSNGIPQAQIAQYCKTEIVFNGLMMATIRRNM